MRTTKKVFLPEQAECMNSRAAVERRQESIIALWRMKEKILQYTYVLRYYWLLGEDEFYPQFCEHRLRSY